MTGYHQSALRELPLGAVRPRGWLRSQLRLQAAGQTGRLPDVWPDVGPDSAWLGGDGEDWERGPYYADGLVPLAHLLDDAGLLELASTWVEAILASQRPDGQFGPVTNDDWWPRMVALKVLTQHADATGDERVVPFLQRYFRYQAAHLPSRPLRSWGHARGADNVLSILWLYERAPDDELLALGRLLLGQTADWAGALTTGLRPEPTTSFDPLRHGPNVAMGLKTPAVAQLLDGDPRHRTVVDRALATLDALHGQVHGMFSGDEWLAGREPHHGVETCQVVEYMYTLENLVRIYGAAGHADLLEQTAFNLLAASNDPRMLAHQYHQQANQVLVSVAQREWTYSGDDANIFGLEPHFGCCTANLHQGWPKFTRSLWMAGPGGLTAVAYAPCSVTAEGFDLDVATSYPFSETVRITVHAAPAGPATLRLRIPHWAPDAALRINDEPAPVDADDAGFCAVTRAWAEGDVLTLVLPMRVRTVERDNGAVGLRYGPLVLALSPGENWRPVAGAPGLGEWEITPRRSWAAGLWLDGPGGPAAWPVRRQPVSDVPFDPRHPPVSVVAPGSRLPQWRLHAGSAGSPPVSPVAAELPVEDMILLPYGSARLRVAEIPVVKPVTDQMS